MKNLKFQALTLALFFSGFTHFAHADRGILGEVKSIYTMNLGNMDPIDQRTAMNELAQAGLDIAGIHITEQSVDLVLSAQERKWLGTFMPSAKIYQRLGAEMTMLAPDNRYPNPETIVARMKALVARYPDKARMVEVGKTNQGRSVMAIHFSNELPKTSDEMLKKPSIIVDGMHHAREVMTPEVALDVAEYLLGSSTVGNTAAHDLLQQLQFWVVPMLNMDGNNIVWTSNSMWRKNARGNGSSIYGVDINRNYPAQWGKCKGSSGSISNDTYRGASAGSEPETQGMMALADQIQPVGYLSYHSYSEIVIYPYGCDKQHTSENKMIKRIADGMASRIKTLDGRGSYQPGTSWEILYAVDGASSDYYYMAYGAPAFVVEVDQSFQPSFNQRDSTVKRNREGWMYFMQEIAQNLLSLEVVDTKSGNAAAGAQVSIDAIRRDSFERQFKTNAAGAFAKVLDPGTYLITVKAADGRMNQMTVQMNGTPQTLKLSL